MSRRSWIMTSAVLGLALAVRAARADEGVEFFEKRVRPVLAERCYSCHSAGADKLKGELRLDTPEGVKKGGVSEMSAVVAGDVAESLLLKAVRWELDDLRMPPKEKLGEKEIADLEAWVKMGAPMPAAQAGPAVAKSEKMSLEEGRGFWSFVPPKEAKVPEVREEQPAAAGRPSEVDAFILEKLKEKGLGLAPEADRRTLIRRATYDLTGLPPTGEEVEAFEKDASPDAYERLVDRLLASPRYGERWGRHWLDVARYADTKGYVFEEERRYAFSYTYRDWVIRALNEDLPYDQFLVQQIASDRLGLKEDKRPLAALGFLTLGRRFINNQHDIIDDRIDVVTRGTMGLTVACSRCHDHKYDPIPAADYYSLYGIFASSTESKELPLLGEVSRTKESEEYEREHARLVAERDAWLKGKKEEIERELRSAEVVARYLIAAQRGIAAEGELPFDTVDDGKALNRFTVARWQKYLKDAAGRRDAVFGVWRELVNIPGKEFGTRVGPEMMRVAASGGVNPIVAREVIGAGAVGSVTELAERYARLLSRYDRAEAFEGDAAAEELRRVLRDEDSPVAVKLENVAKRFNNADANKLRDLQKKVDALAATHPGSPPRAMAMEDAPAPVTPRVFKRGNPGNPGEEVPRRFLAILSGEERKPFTDGSGRLELARAIASKENPLTARVMVNRVWGWHFGQGLVRTPSDFGTRGERPTHPELLDWLAVKFAGEDGWSVKKLHRRIMLSAAYRQSSQLSVPSSQAKAQDADPENRLLWRFPVRRLEFEELRDSLLAASGALDLKEGGRAVDILAQPFVGRRTVYGFIDRQNLPGLFRTFDFASPDGHVARRAETSVPQQALFMINSPFVIEQAKRLASRSAIAAEPDARRKVGLLYRAALGRGPTADEAELAERFVRAEESQKPAEEEKPEAVAWQYGYGEFDEAAGRLKSFTPMPRFVKGSGWQGGGKLPDPKLGWAMLSAGGGHAGNDPAHAVVRRWVAPRDCTVLVEGTLSHNATQGDGVRGRLIAGGAGTLATWNVHNREVGTSVTSVTLKQGEAIDFVVDCGPKGDVGWDQFGWAVRVTKVPTPGAAAGDDAGRVWDSKAEFRGTPEKPAEPLGAWEKLAQVLLQSNEFMFVD